MIAKGPCPIRSPLLLLSLSISISLLLALLLSFSPLLQASPFTGAQAPAVAGERSAVVILAEFADAKHSLSYDGISYKVFVQIDRYFRDLSNGLLSVRGDVVERWYLLGAPESSFNGSFGIVPQAIRLADPEVDFSRYDLVLVVAAGTSESYGVAFATSYAGIVTDDNCTVNDAVFFGEEDPPSIIAHEFAHAFGGLPDLYDYDLRFQRKNSSIYMGPWDLMSGRVYSDPPPNESRSLSSWNLIRLGWMAPGSVASANSNRMTRIDLSPLELNGDDGMVYTIRVPLEDGTFYLIENRQRLAYDSDLPDTGVLIVHVNESTPPGRGPARVQDSTPHTATLDDATFDLRPSKRSVFLDEENDLSVIVLGASGLNRTVAVADFSAGMRALGAMRALPGVRPSISGAHQR